MSGEQLLAYLGGLVPWGGWVLQILGILVVVGQAVVVVTPTTADDVAWERIKSLPVVGPLISALAAFAPIHKK